MYILISTLMILETHDVNASVKTKLKSLIFIPVISRTYCDPKSFAWEQKEVPRFKKLMERVKHDWEAFEV